ncbi:MAG: right-handed parallel beta-helix repeat-containing protein, partial [Thermoplasmatales archaeon]
RRLYIEEADAFLPLDYEITANKGNKEIYLSFNSMTQSAAKIHILPHTKFSCGGGGIHTSGTVEGYYKDGDEETTLTGICTQGPFRQFFYTVRKQEQSAETVYEDIDRYHHTNLVKSSSNKLYVGGIGPDNYTSIQSAIDDSNNGDTVFVHKGIYREALTVNKSILLMGEKRDNVILKPGNNDGIRINADGVEITGFTIDGEWRKGQDNWDESAIDISSSGNFIHGNKIINSKWYGIYIYNSSDNLIENNEMIHNGICIWLCRARENTIRSNNISTLTRWPAIWFYPFSENNIIEGNNFIENEIDIDNPHGKYYKNTFEGNYWDDYIGLNFKILADFNRDGVGFFPHRIDRYTIDSHPMIEPYTSFT